MKFLILTIFMFSGLALKAQDRFLAFQAEDDQFKSERGKKKDGWYPNLVLKANYSLTKTDDVIGKQDGRSVTLGADIDSGLDFFRGQHEWRNELDIQASQSKTPTLPKYVKSADEVEFSTLYLYTLKKISWLGPYAQLLARTSLFEGEDVRSDDVSYQLNGQTVKNGTDFQLTDAFKPLTLKESVGAFAKIINKKKEKLEARLGYGALQVYADGQLAVDEVEDDVVTLKQLEDYSQSGIEAVLTYSRKLDERTKLSLKLEVLMPLDNSDDQNRSAADLTNYDFSGKITSQLYKAISLSYEHRMQKQPQLLDKTQTTDLLLVNLSYDFFAGDSKK